ncbi:hypothetical protein PENTCL1PPCAC_30837 [Pristionchus entomophagus]|uniref:DNA primase large subunit n=1 Tax=Pristionchus entomophagus TaxID=358040 RepID=A0AAV5UR58_9BILA|nr:hypothetical protein PENTCL1PPCAC_22918 [Pristionchus entomophagus]GMT08663.1 hypothetical protein PENTCL1PPCAC_30837 [Pristionchus entomophagus]
MQFDNRSRRSKILRDVNEIKASDNYTFTSTGESNLCMYELAPKEDISLRNFEDIAAQRLKALRKIEELKLRHEKGTHEEYKASMTKELTPIFDLCKLHTSAITNEQRKEYRLNDVIGHFALRLAFCRSPEDTKWFVTHEIELFRYRFQNETKSAIKNFFLDNNFDAELMSPTEKESRIEDLCASYGLSPDKVRSTEIWAMDALDALELVRKRKAFVHSGKVYLEYDSLITIIVQRLRANMYSSMARANQYMGMIEEQDRLLPRLERLTKGGYGGKEFNAAEGQSITRHQIDSASSQFFPLCMSGIQSHLRKNHHLKHGARRQYGLFLKAIGLSLDEAMAFFREEFTQKIDSDKFEKQYGYNIRHMYGKEGKRVEYTAFSCASIILNNPPSHDDCHGCPFKHSTEDGLKSILKSNKIKSEYIDEMIALSKINQFDKACSLHWEVSRGREKGSLPSLITHPNQYYDLARDAAGNAVEGFKMEESSE